MELWKWPARNSSASTNSSGKDSTPAKIRAQSLRTLRPATSESKSTSRHLSQIKMRVWARRISKHGSQSRHSLPLLPFLNPYQQELHAKTEAESDILGFQSKQNVQQYPGDCS